MRFPLNISESLERSSPALRTIFGLVLLGCVCLADYHANWDLSLASLYLLPVSYFAWFYPPWLAAFNAFADAMLWFLIAQFKHAPHTRALALYWNTLIHLAVFFVVVYIMRELRTMYCNERDSSHHDFLTGAENSRSFYELLSAERERAMRYGLVTTVAYMDVDNFKAVNDRFGHLTGNELLIVLARLVRENVRTTDTLARLGGDEFALLMPHTGFEAAGGVLEKLRGILDQEMRAREWPATVSIGAVTFLKPPVSPDDMLRQADHLLYAAKEAGKDKLLMEVSPREGSVAGSESAIDRLTG